MTLKPDGIYAMYLRKSRADMDAEQRGQYETLSHHLQILNELAERYGIHISKIYKELVSGDSIEGRPEVQKLLAEVQSGIYDGILVTEISRLARGRTTDQGMVAEIFRDSGTLIITPSKIYDPTDETDDTYFDFELFMARQEYKYIRKRMIRGRQLSRQNGNWIFGIVPTGYVKEPGTLRLVPSECADQIRSALLGYAHGERNLNETILYLRASIPGYQFHPLTVRRILTNPIYAGYISDRSKSITSESLDVDSYIPANCVPLISLDDHISIANRVKPCPRKKRGTELRNAFAGILRCEKCGHAMVYKADRGACFLLHQRSLSVPDCVCRSVHYEKAYQMISSAIIENLPKESFQPEQDSVSNQIADLKRRLKRTESIRENLFSAFEEGLYTASEFRERKIKGDEEIQGLKRQIQALEGKLKRPPVLISTDDLTEVLRTGSAQQVNDVLKLLISRIDYRKERLHDEPTFTVYFN